MTITVFDLLGRRVLDVYSGLSSVGLHGKSLPLNGLPSGVYFVRLESETAVQTVKFVLTK